MPFSLPLPSSSMGLQPDSEPEFAVVSTMSDARAAKFSHAKKRSGEGAGITSDVAAVVALATLNSWIYANLEDAVFHLSFLSCPSSTGLQDSFYHINWDIVHSVVSSYRWLRQAFQ
jgi:hypothetical protein